MWIVRFANIYHAIKNPRNPLLVIRQIHVWGSLELNFALVAFCMPTYRAVLQKKWFKGKEQKKKSTITTIGGGDANKRERSRETFETEMCLETTGAGG
ncbi:Protein of unknown function [Pyronema omphalodes CBS 100304]|uniref:Uncharacterized protein n=1 Tax=Pyronema omphalodes (strain CBS 100304) TaxID=1076935 RepID=U4KZ78_PYROM|nr:Protein of unknown function [Pyronema omphalodes CBS 100304]